MTDAKSQRFSPTETLDVIVYALEIHGFDCAAFSLLASEEAATKSLVAQALHQTIECVGQ